MPVGVVEDETMIAETIVGAAEAMERCTSTPKTKVRLVGQMSSRICRAIVVVLILTVRIVNVWYPHARPPLSSHRLCLHIVCQQGGSQVVGATAA